MKTKLTKKTKANRNPYSTKRVSTNLGVLPSGNYRARKSVDGVFHSKNFSNKAKAMAWLKSI
jgi:hypothetical protein